MLMQLGSCQFVVKKEENRRLQVIGGGTTEIMFLHGVLPSQKERTDTDSIDNLRAMMKEGRPQLLVSKIGHNHNYWVIEEVRDDLLTEEFKIKLRRYGQSPY